VEPAICFIATFAGGQYGRIFGPQRRPTRLVPRGKNTYIRAAFFYDGLRDFIPSYFSDSTLIKSMFRLAFVVAVSVASRALADCTATFTEGTPYTVSMTELPSFGWVNNATIGFLGVNLVCLTISR
jgi:hypothetical protein